MIKSISVAAMAKADVATRSARRAICRGCDQLIPKPIERCARCGCVIAFKTGLKNTACPLRKW